MIDDAAFRDGVEKAFKKLPANALFVTGGNVMQKVFDEVPHVIVIDEDFGSGEGHSLALNVKEDAVLKYIPVVLIVRSEVPAAGDEPIELCFRKDQDPAHLAFCVGEILKKNIHELDLNPLTHLPGTRSSVLRLEKAVTSKERFSICCIDLSDLAAFNSAYGDARGDEIIVKIGHILQEVLKKEGGADDFVGHLGGDDFVVVTNPGMAIQISEEVIRQFDSTVPQFYDANDRKQGYILQRNHEGTLTQYPIMSVSVALVQHGGSSGTVQMSEISRIASELKRYMKTLPGSCYINYSYAGAHPEVTGSYLEVRFPTKMESVRVPSLAVRSDKYEAFLNVVVRGKKLSSVFQPIVDMKVRRIVGYEALTRCPEGDFASDPASLFSMARESGRTKELDKICVDCALRTAQGLPADRKIFLNLNHETLIDPKSMKTLFSEKGTIGFKNIVIEVTEQSILRSFQKVKDALLELKEQGVSVAIDDVGGGAVSLRDVAVLKPDFIKFDRSLIRQIDSNVTKQQIVLSMLLFANGINAMTTAEGIETKEEYDAVMMCGVPLGQGYFISRPGKAFPEIQMPSEVS